MTEMTGKVHAVVMWLDYTMATEVDEGSYCPLAWEQWRSKPDAASEATCSSKSMVFCTVVLKERDLYASNFSRRARDSTLGADSLPGVGLPDPSGHLSAGISDRRFPLWRCDLGQGCPFHHGVSTAGPVAAASAGGAAGASAWEDESVGVSAFCTHDYSVCSALYERDSSAARRPAPG